MCIVCRGQRLNFIIENFPAGRWCDFGVLAPQQIKRAGDSERYATPFCGCASFHSRYKNLISYAWHEVAQKVRKHQIIVPDNQILIAQLTSRRVKYAQDGRLWLENKQEMRERGVGSPDLADAFVIAFAMQPIRAYPWAAVTNNWAEISKKNGWQAISEKDVSAIETRIEKDSLGEVKVPTDRLWGGQTQRSLEHFSIGKDLIPREMISAYAILKKAAANANHAGKRLDEKRHQLIVQVCDEILAGRHDDMFPLHVWMTGRGTQFNMNVNEVISNRCCQLAGTPLASKDPVHPNDHVNMAQSSNDSFPSAMYIAAAVNTKQKLIPAVKALHDVIALKVEEWKDVIKIGRTHMQDAIPLTLGQEWSGYQGCSQITSSESRMH